MSSCCKPRAGASRQLSQNACPGREPLYKSKVPSKLPILITKYKCPRVEEPARLPKNDVISLLKFEKHEKEIQEEIQERESRVNDIVSSLKLIKESVEKAFCAQMVTQAEIENLDPSDKERLAHLIELKCRQQNELMECLQLEDKYLQDLHHEQRALHEYNVKSQSLACEKVEKNIDELYQQFEGRKDYLYRSRLQREAECRKNARKQKYRAVKTLIERSIDQKLEDLEEQRRKPVPPANRKEVIKKVRYMYRASNLRYRRSKEEAMLSYQGRQYKQRQALLVLKERLDQQRLELMEQNKLQVQKREEEQRRKEAHRQKLIAMGENPYVVDELMRVEAKIRAKERRAEEVRALAIEKIQREVIDRERAYKKAMTTRKKWDKFWAQKAKERRDQHYQQFVKPFLAQPKPSRAERWAKVVEETYGYEPGKPPPCLKGTEPLPVASNTSTAMSAPVKESDEEGKTLNRESQMSIAQKSKGSSKATSPARGPKTKKKSTVAQKPQKPKRGSKGKKGSAEKVEPKPATNVSDGETSEASEAEQAPHPWEALSKHSHVIPAYNCAIIGPQGDWRGLTKDNLGSPLKEPIPITSAFAWSPQTIKFQNYDVGKTYRLRVYVTNKSKQRLKYYFREMIEIGESTPHIPPNPPPSAIETSAISPKPPSSANDSAEDAPNPDKSPSQQRTPRKKKKFGSLSKVTSKQVLPSRHPSEDDEALKAKLYRLSDCIKVNFTVPHPINPGLQHFFEVVFKPKAQGDWAGMLRFASQVGNFDIPIDVLKRRFSPELEQAELVFVDTVVQTGIVKKVKIKNVGGLPGFLHSIVEPQPPKNFSEIDFSTPSLQVIKAPNPLNEESDNEGGSIKVPKSKALKRRSKNEEVHFTEDGPKTPRSGRREDNKESLMPLKYASTKEFSVSSNMNMRKSPLRSRSARKTKADEHFIKTMLRDLVENVTDSIFVTYVDEMRRNIGPGQELTLSVVFRPPFVANFTSKLELNLGKYRTDPPATKLSLDLTGLTVDNPVYIQPLNGDFRICTVNHAYQLTVQAHTTYNKGAGRVRASVPNALKGYVEVFPQESLTLYSTRPCDFAVYFTPRRLMLTSPDLFREYFDPETRIIDFPVYFHLKFPYKVPSPIKATFMAVISDSSLEIEPKVLDMGLCHSAETVKSRITVHNPTIVVQKIGFTDLPDEILVQPNYGFGTIMPDETLEFDVLFTADMKTPEGPHTFTLKMESFGREDYKVQVSCVIRRATVKLSQYKVMFPSTCCGSVSSATVGMKTISLPHKGLLSFPNFQVDLDPSFPITIFPDSGFLEPGKESKLFITFEPTVTVDDVKRTVIQLAQDRHNELMSSYQRELAAIEMHLENNWMLEELAKSPNPQLPPATSKTNVSSLTKLQAGAPPPSGTTESNPATRPSTTTNKKSDMKPPGSAPNNDDAKSGSSGSSKSKGGKRTRPSTAQTAKSSGKGKAKNSKELVKGKKGKKSMSAEKSEDDEDDTNLTPKQKIVRDLEKRKKYVLSRISTPFEPPDVSSLAPDSVEFNRAKRDYLRNLSPFSKTYQVPIAVKDTMSTETIILTLSCPTQRPDLILLDDQMPLDFGHVPIGRKSLKEIHLFNSSQATLALKMSILNPYGPFVQVNALRDLAPEHVYTLKLRFEPFLIGDFEEKILVMGGENELALTLKGTGTESLPAVPSGMDEEEEDDEEEITQVVKKTTRPSTKGDGSTSSKGKKSKKNPKQKPKK